MSDPGPVPTGGDEPGEVAKGAARAHHQTRAHVGDLRRQRGEDQGEPRDQPLPVGIRERVASHQLGREAGHAELDAVRPQETGGVADHHLEAAAAQVEAERGRVAQRHVGADRPEDHAGLVTPADDLHDDPGLPCDAIDDLAAVLRLPDGAGATRDELRRAGGRHEVAQTSHGREHGVGRPFGDPARPSHRLAEAEHLLLAHDGDDRAVRAGVGDEQMERVRTEIDRRDAHCG